MHNSKGSTLIEVIIAATVGILVVTALTFATIFSLRNANFAKNSFQATKLAQEGVERVRTLRDRDGAVNYSGSPGADKFSELWRIAFSCSQESNCYFYFNASSVLTGGTSANLESVPPNFKRQFQIEDVAGAGGNQKRVTVIVTWIDFSGSHESRLTTVLRKL